MPPSLVSRGPAAAIAASTSAISCPSCCPRSAAGSTTKPSVRTSSICSCVSTIPPSEEVTRLVASPPEAVRASGSRSSAAIMADARAEKLIPDNRRARHEYTLSDRYEAGLVLTGTEVKSLRDGRAQIRQAYADIRGNEAWLVGLHIAPYEQGTTKSHDPDRDRKL